MAEYHFRRALNINPVSSVLRCYLSMALHAQNDDNKSDEALEILIQACKIDPKNPQVSNFTIIIVNITTDMIIMTSTYKYNYNSDF